MPANKLVAYNYFRVDAHADLNNLNVITSHAANNLIFFSRVSIQAVCSGILRVI